MKNLIVRIITLLSLVIMMSCQETKVSAPLLSAEKFDVVVDGKQVGLYTLKNDNGLVVQITNYGARIVSLWTPDKHGDFDDIVTGFDNISDYLKQGEYFGATVGRYANRIAKGTFQLDGMTYSLACNNDENHLHGGTKGFWGAVWDVENHNDNRIELSYLSRDMEEGYPGNLDVTVVYTLNNNNELTIEYDAETDKTTIVNLTHHSFFNLKGFGKGSINDHLLEIDADAITPVDEGLISTGAYLAVEDTPFDFRTPKHIGQDLEEDDSQLTYGLGYDHNWVLNENKEDVRFAARLTEPESGRTMEVYTNEPGLQFYGGNFLNGSENGKYGKTYAFREALCLETQHFPDSPNHPNFPSTTLKKGDHYQSICIYKFN